MQYHIISAPLSRTIMPGFITKQEMTAFIAERLEHYEHLNRRLEQYEVAYEIFNYIHSNFSLFKLHFSSHTGFLNTVSGKCKDALNNRRLAQECPKLVDKCREVNLKVQSILLAEAKG